MREIDLEHAGGHRSPGPVLHRCLPRLSSGMPASTPTTRSGDRWWGSAIGTLSISVASASSRSPARLGATSPGVATAAITASTIGSGSPGRWTTSSPVIRSKVVTARVARLAINARSLTCSATNRRCGVPTIGARQGCVGSGAPASTSRSSPRTGRSVRMRRRRAVPCDRPDPAADVGVEAHPPLADELFDRPPTWYAAQLAPAFSSRFASVMSGTSRSRSSLCRSPPTAGRRVRRPGSRRRGRRHR